jgi:hypothetical protein
VARVASLTDVQQRGAPKPPAGIVPPACETGEAVALALTPAHRPRPAQGRPRLAALSGCARNRALVARRPDGLARRLLTAD